MSNDLERSKGMALDPFTPDNYPDLWKLAGHLSNSGILPRALEGKPGAVLSIMSRGMFLGIPWAVAVQEAYVVHGRVCWPASILAAIVSTSPEFEFFEILEADDEHATVEAKKHRWDKPREYTVDMAQARTAGYLDGKHSEQWKLRPRFMLIAMARREAARMWDPVRCAGLYTPEELEAGRGVRLETPEASNRLVAGDLAPVQEPAAEPVEPEENAPGWEAAKDRGLIAGDGS